jgi:hypothetical protein
MADRHGSCPNGPPRRAGDSRRRAVRNPQSFVAACAAPTAGPAARSVRWAPDYLGHCRRRLRRSPAGTRSRADIAPENPLPWTRLQRGAGCFFVTPTTNHHSNHRARSPDCTRQQCPFDYSIYLVN